MEHSIGNHHSHWYSVEYNHLKTFSSGRGFLSPLGGNSGFWAVFTLLNFTSANFPPFDRLLSGLLDRAGVCRPLSSFRLLLAFS